MSIHRPEGRSTYVVQAEIPQPWREQFQQALRGSACPLVEGVGHCACDHDWQAWVRDEWYSRPRPKNKLNCVNAKFVNNFFLTRPLNALRSKPNCFL